MKVRWLLSMLLMAFLMGCASASYKSREEGLTTYGYEEKQITVNKFALDYYGAKSDSYEYLEKLWHQRAAVVCGSNHYTANIQHETYQGKTFILLPPFFLYDEKAWPLLKGELVCRF